MGRIGKILTVGFITTAVRIVGQMFIPSYEQNVLMPSIFVERGMLPVVFSLYALVGYSIVSALYLLVEESIPGSRITKGIKYGFAYCMIWAAYLLEPLPHGIGADFISLIAYPLADGVALIVMGLLVGMLLTKDNSGSKARQDICKEPKTLFSYLLVFACFVAGRILQYDVLGVYSLFETHYFETLLWITVTGVVVSVVMVWFGQYVSYENKIFKALLLGGVLYGVNMTVFNFFIPLVFRTDVVDLLTRTVVDVLFVTLGMLSLPAVCHRTHELEEASEATDNVPKLQLN